ncbi:MAG: hypothetical protein ACJ75Q_03060 [Gaiellaceae bacterium]
MRCALTSLALALALAAPAQAERRVEAPPPAGEFARVFVGLTSAYAQMLDAQQPRIGHAHCVQAVPGHYMCSYALARPGRPLECHIMQALWTPRQASTITVTLAGRSSRCGSLREAIASLR